MKRRRFAAHIRRGAQLASLVFFLRLLALAAWPELKVALPPDLFLRLDPLASLLSSLTAREWLASLAPGLALVALTVCFGRFFCGYICPMGTTLDIARFFGAKIAGKKRNSATPLAGEAGWRRVKYFVLIVMAATAFFGVNTYFWGSPIALATRFYALVLHPVLLLAGDGALRALGPVFTASGLDSAYISLPSRRYDAVLFVLFFFAGLFLLERVRPRFWCRYLCPAGAVLALAARRPLWRRKVTRCSGCGTCAALCPTTAIAPGGIACAHGECLACRACVDVCPVNGLAFTFSNAGERGDAAAAPVNLHDTFRPSRRAFVGAACAGAVLAGAQYSGAHSLLGPDGRGTVWGEGLIRPPGSVPEADFLDRCLRCGLCMKACPENALQPAWLAAGAEGVFSPIVMPRRGPCEPDCNVCGRVCPTAAIAPLRLEEKRWAKIGTAVVLQYRCLAWAEGRRCMVCQEVCPYGSVTIVQKSGQAVPVPVVDASRCFGCGYCENHCPTRLPAIVVQPLNALRLPGGEGYETAARSLGLVLTPGAHSETQAPQPIDDLPPGFTQ